MAKRKKVILFTILGLGSLTAMYFLFIKKKSVNQLLYDIQQRLKNITGSITGKKTDIETEKGTGLIVDQTVSKMPRFPLQPGSTGNDVKNLQMAFNDLYDAGLVEDGVFGPATQDFVYSKLNKPTVTKDEYEIVMNRWENPASVYDQIEMAKLTL
jgi:hypothetical protein